jgi:hypothetical protein
LDFETRWGTGAKGTIWKENMTRGECNRQKGIHHTSLVACALDPRLKTLNFIDDEDANHIWTEVQIQCLVIANNLKAITVDLTDTNEVSSVAVASSSIVDDIFGDLQYLPSNSAAVDTTTEIMILHELQYYRRETGLPMRNATNGCNDPLQWWRQRETKFPHIALLARRILCIPATFAPAERVFSKAGLTISKFRSSRMVSNNADMAIFLDDNFHLFKQY